MRDLDFVVLGDLPAGTVFRLRGSRRKIFKVVSSAPRYLGSRLYVDAVLVSGGRGYLTAFPAYFNVILV
jgi:hypothetical protein